MKEHLGHCFPLLRPVPGKQGRATSILLDHPALVGIS
jgi:hypothetical protein